MQVGDLNTAGCAFLEGEKERRSVLSLLVESILVVAEVLRRWTIEP